MAKSKAPVKSEKPKARKLQVGKKAMQDLAPRDTQAGATKGGRYLKP